MATIDVYTTNYCPYCTRAKDLLKRKGLDFVEHDVTGDDEARMALVEKSGGRKTVPQTFINGEAIGGFDDLAALDKSGKLAEMVA